MLSSHSGLTSGVCIPVNRWCAVIPHGSGVTLLQHRETAVTAHHHPVALAGVQGGHSIQVIVVVALTSHQGDKESHLLWAAVEKAAINAIRKL